MSNKINLKKFLWQFISKKKFTFLLLIILTFVFETISTFVGQIYNKKMFESIELNNINFYYSFILIFLYALFQNIDYVVNNLIKKVHFESINKTQTKIRNYLFNYSIQHSISYFNNSFSGDLNNKINSITNDFEKFIDTINNMITLFLVLFLTPLFYANINIYLSLSFIFIAVIYILSLTKIKKSLKIKAKIKAESTSKYIGFVNDDFINISNIKIFAKEKKEQYKSNGYINEIDKTSYDYLQYFRKFRLINLITVFFLIFPILLIAGILLINKNINFGNFMFITIIVSIMRYVLDEISEKLLIYSELYGKIENNLNKILQPIEIDNKTNNKIKISNGKIEFKNVSFKY